ncbi:MAG: glycosyltransferase family 4 protein [Planctomycetes bacterium]|nr:glycosyltransferase family 4 protein [Planctomycetota bacterium]
MLKPGYITFFYRCKAWIKQALESGEHFALAHQLSPLAMRYPSPLMNSNIPYIMGPLGGSFNVPDAFKGEIAEPWYVKMRNFDQYRFLYDPWLKATYTKAQCVLGVAPYVQSHLNHLPLKSFHLMSEIGFTDLPEVIAQESLSQETQSSETHQVHATKKLNLLYVGRVIRTKGLIYLLKALKELLGQEVKENRLDFHLHIAGVGLDLDLCKSYAEENELAQKTTFYGQIPLEQVWMLYRNADLFILPSIREPSGNAVLEAMSFGVPVICSDLGGPGYSVSDEVGIKVPSPSPMELVKGLKEALLNLSRDPEIIYKMGQAARKSIQEKYLWQHKTLWLKNEYMKIITDNPV